MAKTLIENWLDRWEQICESGQNLSLDQFIAQNCKEMTPELVAKFREQALALESMNRKLKAAGLDTSDSSGATADTKRPESGIQPGTEPIPGHVLESRLGKGGFGEVWKARAPGGFHVALKFVQLERRVGATELRALDTIKNIRHPNLLSVVGAYQREGQLIIAMEMAERTLEQRFREARDKGLSGIPRDELLEYMAEAAKGLDYLNEPRHKSEDGTLHGIQHRDIKPQNLLLSGGSVKVGDFGLARCLENNLASHTGSLTAAYAAPEFFQGQTTSHSDQYSLAVTYCQLRGGRLPFTGTAAELMSGHLNRKPDLSMLPSEERPVVARALAKEAKDRWPSCGEFVKALRQAQPSGTQTTTQAAKSPAQPRVVPAQMRTKWLIGGAVAMVATVALLLIVGLAIWSRLAQRDEIPGKKDNLAAAPVKVPGETENKPSQPATPPVKAVKEPNLASVQRGFGDTVLKYADRSYEGAAWKKIEEANSLGLRANAKGSITLHSIIGWDDDSFWVAGCNDVTVTRGKFKALAFHCRKGNWSIQADLDTKSVLKTWQRLLAQDTLLLMTGDRVFEISPRGNVECAMHPDSDSGEICPIGPGQFFIFTPGRFFASKDLSASRVVDGKQSGLGKTGEAFVHRDENILIKDRPVAGIRHTRALAPGKVIGVHTGLGTNDTMPMIVSYRNGFWHQVADLPKRSLNDIWVYGEEGSPRFLVAVGQDGRGCIHHFGGQRSEFTVPTSQKLLKVWGVSPEKFWVMDNSGTVWQRAGYEWQAVVHGKGGAFVDAWVSVSGTVVAVTKTAVLQLK
jgi:hypothetical protein